MVLDLQNAESVRETFLAGAAANRTAACRVGSIDRIEPPGTLIATGDLHDNPLHFSRLVAAAGMEENRAAPESPTHLVLHEIIHSDRLMNGMDFSYRALARVAALKARFPERAHTLLANHELAQIFGAGIIKDGIKVVEAFNDAVEYAFGEEAGLVQAAIKEFILSMPLALRCVCPGGDILVCHSLPTPALMERFDPTVLSRELTEADYEPRRGAAHLLVWGRGYDAEQIEDLVERWGINLFILGHEKAENGVKLIPPCAVILNSDHEKGVYLPIDLAKPPRAEEAIGMVVPLSQLGAEGG
jgi:hypothetical protein